jgi:hypothetical protein
VCVYSGVGGIYSILLMNWWWIQTPCHTFIYSGAMYVWFFGLCRVWCKSTHQKSSQLPSPSYLKRLYNLVFISNSIPSRFWLFWFPPAIPAAAVAVSPGTWYIFVTRLGFFKWMAGCFYLFFLPQRCIAQCTCIIGVNNHPSGIGWGEYRDRKGKKERELCDV